jgi:hypothetical protein
MNNGDLRARASLVVSWKAKQNLLKSIASAATNLDVFDTLLLYCSPGSHSHVIVREVAHAITQRQ